MVVCLSCVYFQYKNSGQSHFGLDAPLVEFSMTTTKDISYIRSCQGVETQSDLQKLDLYLPSQSADAPRPIIVYIHGGAWRSGDKCEYSEFARHLSDYSDSAVAVINYRLSVAGSEEEADEPVRHPAHVQDCAAAVSFLADSASAYGLDGKRIYIVGHSAGGQLGGLLVFQPEYLQAGQLDEMPLNTLRSSIRGVVGVAGIYDIPFLLQTYPQYISFISQAFGSDPATYESASPQYKVPVPGDPPLPSYLIAQSSEDELIDRPQAERYYRHLQDHLAGPLLELDFNFTGGHFEMLQSDEWIKRVAKFVKDVEMQFCSR